MSDTTFDYIIIGAGTPAACWRTAFGRPSKRVLLIEAGPRDDYHWIHIPVGYLYCIGNPRTDWLYQTEADAGLNGRQLRYPRGKTLGGCSSINGMIYMRARPAITTMGQLTGDARWTWANCLPHFKKHEDGLPRGDASTAPAANGGSNASACAGTSWMHSPRPRSRPAIPASEDFNRGDNEGVGYFLVNQRNGWRWNTAKAFLRPTCYGRPNSELWTSAPRHAPCDPDPAGRPQALHRRAGLDRAGDGQRPGRARSDPQRGSIGSPQILQLSGIGPGDLLQQHGIALVHELPGVGANLQDHLQIRAVFKVDGVATLNTMANSWWARPESGSSTRSNAAAR